MCKKSESIKELAIALAKFNAEVPKIGKDATNPHFRNRYATLDNIIDEVKPLLAKHGLSIIQIPGGDGEMFTMTTMLLHVSGEWIESEPLKMRPVKNDPQGIGSCSTYARRYGMAAFLGLSTGEDDDANYASQPTQTAQKAPQSPPQGTPNTPQPPAQQSRSNVPKTFKAEAYNLRQMHNLEWNELQKIAERVLGRKLGRVTELQDDKDWELIVNELKAYAVV